jgi:transcriptional regulator with XRE-family HTH domain
VDVRQLVVVARARSGLSQRELAQRSGTSAAAICQYEGGQRTPRVDTLARIVEAAGASLVFELRWPQRTTLDLERNGRILADLLDLADHLPRRSKPRLEFPPFGAIAR